MKKFGIYFLLSAALVGMTLNSCDKDEFSEEDAMNLQDKLDKNNTLFNDTMTRVSYTVNVVDASTSTLKSGSAVNAVAGAVVKLVQDTAIKTATVDASGIVTFSNLKQGLANVNITLANYSEVNYTVDLSTGNFNGRLQMSNIIPLIPIAGTSAGTISGKVTLESDLTNLTPEPAANVRVIAMIDPDNSGAIQVPGNGIEAISYDKLSLSATTDANGNYSMVVPTTINGLKYKMIIPDFTVDQKLLQDTYNDRDTFGVLTIPANFGNNFTSPSSVSAGTPVIVKIGAPDYTYTQATATAVIDNSMGIDYIHNVNVGGYYEEGTYYYTIENTNPEGSDATVRLDVDGYGHASASIWSGGSKFNSSLDGTTIEIPYFEKAARARVTAVDGGKISEYEISANHRGILYSYDNLQLVKHTGSGVGVVTDLPGTVTYSGDKQQFSTGTYTLATSVGSGYAVGDSLILAIASDKSNTYKGKIFLSNGQVTAINITNEGANYISGQVDIIISSPATGTTAEASATVKDGKIETITVDDNGSGYKTAPTVTIVNKAEKIQAVYSANVSNGQITGFNDDEQGNGYLAVPTVTISSAIPGAGSGVAAYPTVSGGKVTDLTLVNKGNGYRGNTPAASKTYSIQEKTITGSTSTIINIDLGTGKRTVED